MKKLSHLSRRQAVAMMGACGLTPALWDPMKILMNGLVDGIIAKAQADTGTVAPRNFVYVNMSGGPPRWYWDLPLIPYGNPGFLANPGVATRFIGAGLNAGAASYETYS